MKLYICWGLFKTPGSGHPCRNAWGALLEAGYDPEIVRTYGWGLLPKALNRGRGRAEIRRLTGQEWAPVLVTEQGDVVRGSKAILGWAATHSKHQRA